MYAGPLAIAAALFAVPVGVAHAALGAIALRTGAEHALDAIDRTILGISRVIAAGGTIVALPLVLSHLRDAAALASTVIPWLVASVVLPALVAAATFALRRSRLRWLRRVDQGLVPRWRIVSATPGSNEQGLPPVFAPEGQDAHGAARVLVAVEPSQEPFRSVEVVRPIAIAPERT